MHILKALVAQYPCTKFREISSKDIGARGHQAETQNCALWAQFWPLGVVTCMARVPYQGASTPKVWGLCDLPCAAYPNISPAQLWLILLTTLAPPFPAGGARGEYSSLVGEACIVDPGHRALNPRPGGGLSHLRHGGGAKMTPPLTRKLGKLEGRAIRRSRALSEPVRSHFGHFFAQVNIEVSRGHQRSNFRKMMVLSGMPAIISGTIIATPNPKKAKDSSWNVLSLRWRQISPKINRLSVRGHERSKTAFLSETVFQW